MIGDKGAKQYTMLQLFTEAEREAIVKLWNTDAMNFHKRVLDEIVAPALPRINRFTGQANDARYIAYTVEASISINTAFTRPPSK